MRKINLTFCALFFSLLSAFAQNQTTVIDSIFSGNIYRNYRLYIPKKYDSSQASSLIIDLHGYTSNALQQQAYSNFKEIADTANFFVVYPNGTFYGQDRFWNAGISPSLANDVAFISELVDHIHLKYGIDLNRVYACGMSNGGFMSHTLACALNNKIAAIASVTGSMFTSQYNSCVPSRVVPVMQIQGTADKTVPYAGNSAMLATDTLVNFWVKKNNCNPDPVIDSVPDINKADSCKAVHYLYKNGMKGATCEFYKILGGGHSWPGAPFKIAVTNEDFNASEKIWLFFRKYKLSDMAGVNELMSFADISMYPNPCSDQLNVEGETVRSISIIDCTGKIVMSTGNKQVNVSSLAKGIYSVIVVSKGGQIVKRLVKL